MQIWSQTTIYKILNKDLGFNYIYIPRTRENFDFRSFTYYWFENFVKIFDVYNNLENIKNNKKLYELAKNWILNFFLMQGSYFTNMVYHFGNLDVLKYDKDIYEY